MLLFLRAVVNFLAIDRQKGKNKNKKDNKA